MNKALLRAALLTSTLAAVLLPASPATAATLAYGDPTGDVWRSTFDVESEQETIEPAGSPVNADLVRTTVRHTATKVVLKGRYADLQKAENRYLFGVELRTDEGLKREIGVETLSRPGWGGTPYFAKRDGETPCRGLGHSIDYATETVTVTVPRTCLSKPRWVQVRSMSVAFEEGGEVFSAFVDSGHDETADEPREWSGKVRRG